MLDFYLGLWFLFEKLQWYRWGKMGRLMVKLLSVVALIVRL